MSRPAPIRLDADTWAIIRDAPDRPAAIVHRITDVGEVARFLVLQWHLDPAKRRMTGIYESLKEADDSVRYDMSKVAEAMAMTAGPPNGGGSTHASGGVPARR